MKKNIIAIALVLAGTFLQAQSLNLQGKLTNVKDASTVSLIDGVTSKELISSKSVAGSFSLQAQLEYPSLLILSIDGITQKIPVFVGNENVMIADKLQKWTRTLLLTQQAMDLPMTVTHELKSQFLVPQLP